MIGILCFTLLVFPSPIESARPHKPEAVHPLPLQLNNVHHYETFIYPGGSSLILPLRAGVYDVGTDKNHEYVIGVIFYGDLYPLIAPRADLNNKHGRVKICIDGNDANKIVPILESDPLNSLFRNIFGRKNVCSALVNG